MADVATSATGAEDESKQPAAPHPGSQQMPPWNVADLIPPPRFTWKNWFALLGPGLVLGGAAIGGGEWLIGPEVTARYGGSLLWLATLSILGQVVYNIEISRYALYSGEPIFTGKFRTLPGPQVWLLVYLVLDFGAIFPYLAASAATPVAAVILGHIPDAENIPSHRYLLKGLGIAIFLLALVPLIFGGKIYNSLKAVMAFKIVTVLSFLLVLAVLYSSRSTWEEIGFGFFKFGSVPVQAPHDPAQGEPGAEALPRDHVDNVFVAMWEGRPLPPLDLTLMSALCALAAIAGSGGLTNTPISNYTRDQGWGMGWHVGAIPSAVGGRNIKLSHVGTVFVPTPESLERWRGWYRHVMRDQLVVWMPACFLGLALPSMLSVEFLPRGTVASEWTAAGMTADGVAARVTTDAGETWGRAFWYMTLFCGFLVLGPTMATTADGLIRRWVDVFWTSSRRLRKWDPHDIGRLYFSVLAGFSVFGVLMLSINKPQQLIYIATLIMNFALGFSCLHVLVVNMVLLPKPLRPGWFVRISLVLSAIFFLTLAAITTYHTLSN